MGRELKKKEMQENTRKVFKKSSPPKYMEIEKRFEEEFVMQDLEEKKKRLQMIRDLHKPLNHKDLTKHSKKVDLLMR